MASYGPQIDQSLRVEGTLIARDMCFPGRRMHITNCLREFKYIFAAFFFF